MKSQRIRMTSFFLSVLVIFIHSYNIELYPEFEGKYVYWVENIMSNIIGWLAVPSFFMISGYLFFNNFDLPKTSVKFKTRLRSLLVPYLLWNSVFFVFFLIVTNIPFLSPFFSTSPMKPDFSTVVHGVFLYKYNIFYWYIYQLMIYVLISPLLFLVFKNKMAGLSFILFIFVLNCRFSEIPVCNGYGIMTLYFMFYLIGAYVALYHNVFMIEKPAFPLMFIVLTFTVLILLRIYMYFSGHTENIYSVLYTLDYIAAVLTLYILLGYITCGKDYNVFKLSFIIYTVHPYIVGMIKKLYANIFPHTEFHAIINYVLSVLIGFVVSCVFGLFLNKYFKRLYCILSGGR